MLLNIYFRIDCSKCNHIAIIKSPITRITVRFQIIFFQTLFLFHFKIFYRTSWFQSIICCTVLWYQIIISRSRRRFTLFKKPLRRFSICISCTFSHIIFYKMFKLNKLKVTSFLNSYWPGPNYCVIESLNRFYLFLKALLLEEAVEILYWEYFEW